MRAHELVKEIQYAPHIGKDNRSVYPISSMKYNYKYDNKTSRNIERYDIPELPDHTIEIFNKGNTSHVYLINDDTEEIVAIVDINKSIPNFFRIESTKVVPAYQGKRIGPTIYKFIIVDLGVNLISDDAQSPGGAKLWANLAKDPEIKVVAYDLATKKSSPVVYDSENQRLAVANPKAINNQSLYVEYTQNKVVLLATKR